MENFIHQKRFYEIQISIFLPKYTRYGKNCFFKRTTILAFTIFLTEVISFVYQLKILLKIKDSLSKQNYTKYEKNVKKQNFSPPNDLKIHFRQFFTKNK